MNSFMKSYSKHIRNARKAAKGHTGLDRAHMIYHYFADNTCHPSPFVTYNQFMINRTSDYQFPTDLMHHMAAVVAENENL